MKRNRFLRVFKFALLGVGAAAVAGFLVMSLWNALMPGIFAVRPIGFWQALGLLLLSKILLGGFRLHSGGPPWRRRMLDRWGQMTPEEREKFKQGLRRGCGRREGVETPNSGAEARA
jgi:hypothetical protein